VLLVSCVSAILCLACIAAGLLISQVIRSSLQSAWRVLPHVNQEKCTSRPGTNATDTKQAIKSKADGTPQGNLVGLRPPNHESDTEFEEEYYDADSGISHSSPLVRPIGKPTSRSITPDQMLACHKDAHAGFAPIEAPLLDMVVDPYEPSQAPRTTQQGPGSSLTLSTARQRQSPSIGIDAALAMQLRPGLGVGAEAAWLVRFIMAFFGWFAAALVGRRP